MIARFGSAELDCLLNYAAITSSDSRLKKAVKFATGRANAYWWEDRVLTAMARGAGFFPTDTDLVERFCQRMYRDMTYVDVLGSWLRGERRFNSRLSDARRVTLRDLSSPWLHERPWTQALEGRTVLVIHPFAQSVREQYSRRGRLFANPRVLPDFELKVIKAVQAIAGTPTRFRDWFEALDSMIEKAARTEFDIAVIGCGAFGFPLAAEIKRMGKQSVHLGAATQLLFGIKGKRWDDRPDTARLYNEYWVRPRPDERPDRHEEVEGGAYW